MNRMGRRWWTRWGVNIYRHNNIAWLKLLELRSQHPLSDHKNNNDNSTNHSNYRLSGLWKTVTMHTNNERSKYVLARRWKPCRKVVRANESGFPLTSCGRPDACVSGERTAPGGTTGRRQGWCFGISDPSSAGDHVHPFMETTGLINQSNSRTNLFLSLTYKVFTERWRSAIEENSWEQSSRLRTCRWSWLFSRKA